MRITFHGAAGTVTGTRHLLEARGRKVLLDCGLVQGRRDEANRRNREFGFSPAQVDALVLSHAHIDHSGAIPSLVREGFRGVVHATMATADLASYMLRDSGHLQERDAEFANKRMARRGSGTPPRSPLYTVADAERALENFAAHPYYRPFPVLPGITAMFHDAGHILGSAIVELTVQEDGGERSVVFTGDLGRPRLPIIRDPDPVPARDVLLIESTYGDRQHADMGDAARRLAGIVRAVHTRGGKLIVPAFAVGRTQDIVYELVQLARADRIPQVPIYVDSPLAVDATEVFERHPECYDPETREILRAGGDPFGLSSMHYLRTREESMALNERAGPCLIVSASGMMEGGRILHHLRNGIGDPRNAVLIVGFQAENTLGRKILRGDRVVNIFGEPHEVRAEVYVMNEYSAHADREELLGWFRSSGGAPHDIFVVHGEEEQSQRFARHLRDETAARIHLPRLHESFEPVGSRAEKG
jgi:metallo-beta-lactamase family protein